MEFNNKYYLTLFPKIKGYIDLTEMYINTGNLELACLNLRRVIEHIDREFLKNDNWYIKIQSKNNQMPSLDNMNTRLYELRIINEEQLMLFQYIRKLTNEYVHGTRDTALLRKDKKTVNKYCTQLNTYLPILPERFGIKYTKKQIKDIRKNEITKNPNIFNKLRLIIKPVY